jgi:hypothetical protein
MKRSLVVLTLFLSVLSYGQKPSGSSVIILDDKIATGAGDVHKPNGAKRTAQCMAETSAGAGTASIAIEVSNDNTNWITAGTISLSFDDDPIVDDGFVMDSPWRYLRANVTAISGTDATVDCWLGAE